MVGRKSQLLLRVVPRWWRRAVRWWGVAESVCGDKRLDRLLSRWHRPKKWRLQNEMGNQNANSLKSVFPIFGDFVKAMKYIRQSQRHNIRNCKKWKFENVNKWPHPYTYVSTKQQHARISSGIHGLPKGALHAYLSSQLYSKPMQLIAFCFHLWIYSSWLYICTLDILSVQKKTQQIKLQLVKWVQLISP
jgi:hypothetical protein